VDLHLVCFHSEVFVFFPSTAIQMAHSRVYLLALTTLLVWITGAIREPSAIEILERQLQNIEGSGSTAAELTLHNSIGHLCKDAGQYEKSVMHYEAVRGLAAHLGDSERLASSLQSLGLVKFHQGKLADARAHLEMSHALLDTGSVSAMEVMHNLGNVHREMGHFAAALELYEMVQKNASSADGFPTVLVDIGELLARQGNFAKALSLVQQATKQLSNDRNTYGDTAVAEAYSVLGAIHHAQGDLLQAEGLYKKALVTQTREFRSGHPDLVSTQMRKARLLRDLGNNNDAVRYASMVEGTLRHGQDDGPDLISCLVMKSDLLRQETRYDEAEHAIDEALALHSQCCAGEDTPDVAVAIHTHGSILHDQGKLDDAIAEYKRALGMNLQTVGLQHLETAAVHNSLGTAYQDAGDDSSAEIHFAKCLDVQLQTVGTQSPEVANTYNNLATILFRRGSLSEAQQLFEKALQVMDAAGVPASNPDRTVYADNLSEVIASLQASQGIEVV